mgnify:CR=1 FL=1
MIDYKIMQDNLIKVLSNDNDGIYLVGFAGQFRTSRR